MSTDDAIDRPLDEGDHCPMDECDGELFYPQAEDCSCHIAPPCGACTSTVLTCNECGEEYPDGKVPERRSPIREPAIERPTSAVDFLDELLNALGRPEDVTTWADAIERVRAQSARCTCDDAGDGECPRHARESALQDRAIKAENELADVRRHAAALEARVAELTEKNVALAARRPALCTYCVEGKVGVCGACHTEGCEDDGHEDADEVLADCTVCDGVGAVLE